MSIFILIFLKILSLIISETIKEHPKILALGDSLSSGYRNRGKGWIGDLGYNYDNIGISGATISTVNTKVTNIFTQLLEYNPTVKPDIIIGNGGENDYCREAPMGRTPTFAVKNDEEAETLDKSTILGALEYLFYNMIKLYPRAYRFFIFSHKVFGRSRGKFKDWTVTPNTMGYTQADMYVEFKKVCDIYGVYIIDIFHKGMLNTGFKSYVSGIPYSVDKSMTYREITDVDGEHPTDFGYRLTYLPLIKQALRDFVFVNEEVDN